MRTALCIAMLCLVAVASADSLHDLFSGMLKAQKRVIRVQSTEVMLPMRDGVKLHTIIDMPIFENAPSTNLTAVMDRSPYGQDATEMFAFASSFFGHVGIRQDMRGTKKSEGNFTIWHSDANDAYDTMQWAAKQPWSNGKVQAVGASADGLAAFTEPLANPQWLSAYWIIFSSALGHEIIFPGGVYQEALTNFWMQATVPKFAAQCIAEIQSNEAPGAWWDALNMTGHFQQVSGPSTMWGGWYDIFLRGNIFGFDGFQKSSATPGKSRITIDPLGHCQGAAKYFPRKLIAGRALLPILQGGSLWLYNGEKQLEPSKVITFYVMGPDDHNLNTAGNYWTTLDEWPVWTPTKFYFNANGALTTTPPTAPNSTSVSYVFDPKNPVPTIGGSNLQLPCGPLDQRPVEQGSNRTDVLSFTSAPLTAHFVATGPIDATLYVSSSANDTDFTVKITDVYPTGESRIIQDGAVRMRWRNLGQSSVPSLITPGTVYKVDVSLWNTSYVWAAGHKIRVSVSSSNYPRYSVNPNNGQPLINTKAAPVVAKNTLWMSAAMPSHIRLPQVSFSQLPEFNVMGNLLGTEEQIKDMLHLVARNDPTFDLAGY